MASHRLLGVFGQVVPQMPAIGDLDRARRAGPGALGVVAGPVPADDSRARMRRQPRLEAGGLPVRQQVDHVPGAHVHQHRPVHLALGQREVIDPEHLRRGRDLRIRRRRDQAQHRRGVHGDPEGPGQPGGGPPGQLQPEPGQHPQQRDAAPPVPPLSPSACSAKVTAGQAGFRQRNRRTCKTISTGRPPAAPSATIRAYPPCTRADSWPHRGQHAASARHDATIITASPASSTRCTRSPARCGNSTASSACPCPETSQTTRAAELAGPAGGMTD